MKKIYLYLSGGLGNQLFEYAAAKNLALNNNAKLIIDTKTGFLLDFRDPTKFSLNKSSLNNVEYKNFCFTFFFYRIFKKFLKKKSWFYKFINFSILDDTFLDKYEEKINEIEFNKLFMLGYYQSEKYFHKNRNLIIKELYPSIPQDTKYIKLSEKISKNNSIAIGVRMHENIDTEFGIRISDKRKARMIAGIGGITPINFYLNAINKMSDKIKDPNFFLFSTKKTNLDSLIQKSEILQNCPLEIVTADCGFENAYDNLWLMSKFSNFIISNSTLYWWAAYFSMLNSNSNYVICSKRFPNKDIYINEWEKSE